MNLKNTFEPSKLIARGWIVLFCVVITLPVSLTSAQEPQQAPAVAQSDEQLIPADQLDSLVAPVALYPDPLLAQVLAASTYPLELIQLQQWLGKNEGLKDEALTDAVSQEPWDPSVQAMATLPDVVKWLTDDIQWTTDLGNAFLAQQGDVMDAVQRMRKKANEQGNLESGEQIKVETQVVESKQVIIIEQSDPQIIYVPSYNPVVVYGPPVYPYPPIYYPPPGYYAGRAIAFGVGVAIGVAWGGGWGWHCGWGRNNININVHNHYNRNVNINRGGGGNNWNHNPNHRGGTPYSNRSTANKFGGNARGDSLSSRQANARQQPNRQGGSPGAANRSADRSAYTTRAPAPSARNSGGANRAGSRDVARPAASNSGANRAGSRDVARPAASNSGANRAGSRDVARPAGGSSANRVGNRDMSRPAGSSSRNAMGSGNRSKGYNGASTRSSANRGASSMQARGGGGRRR